MSLRSKVRGALYGVAIGDAMGAPVEGWMPERIRREFGRASLARFLPPTHGGDPAMGKGAGRVTDDTLMTEVLIRAYLARGDHLDACGYADFMIPLIMDRKMWIPEQQREGLLYDRLWHPEKYPAIRIRVANADPRTAGVGNCVNCGVAMWMMPAGAVNAGDPFRAYREAASIGAAHNESFAVEAGAVMAAAVAAAFGRRATIRDTLDAAVSFAREGTGAAIRACLAAVRGADSVPTWIRRVRAAVEPYDQRAGHVPDDKPLLAGGVSDVGRPSRLHAIEELPVALAALACGGGDFARTLRAAVFYGRDCDSIAGMAAGLYGAVHGVERIPADLRAAVDAANRRDYGALADEFAAAIRSIAIRDRARLAAQLRAVGA